MPSLQFTQSDAEWLERSLDSGYLSGGNSRLAFVWLGKLDSLTDSRFYGFGNSAETTRHVGLWNDDGNPEFMWRSSEVLQIDSGVPVYATDTWYLISVIITGIGTSSCTINLYINDLAGNPYQATGGGYGVAEDTLRIGNVEGAASFNEDPFDGQVAYFGIDTSGFFTAADHDWLYNGGTFRDPRNLYNQLDHLWTFFSASETSGDVTGSDPALADVGRLGTLDLGLGPSGSPSYTSLDPVADKATVQDPPGDVAAYNSTVVDAGGNTATLIFDEPSDGWDVSPSFEVVEDPADWPVFTVGAGGNANTLHVYSVGTPSLNGSSQLEIPVTLTGRGFDGETVTVTVPSGFVTETVASQSTQKLVAASVDSTGVTATQGDALTRQDGTPVVNWAYRDQWPESGSTARIALDAYDDWAGVEWVQFHFDGPVAVVADADVSDQGSNVYRITAKRAIDLYGKGVTLGYWYLDLDLSGESDGTVATVSEVTVRTKDGVSHTRIADGTLTEREIVKLASPTVRYLDSTATGVGDGTSWADAWTSLSQANANVGTSADIVYIAPGTYTEATGIDFGQSGRTKFLRWVADLNQTGDGSGALTLDLDANSSVGSWQALEGIDVVLASEVTFNGQSKTHISFEDLTRTWPDKLGFSLQAFSATSHVSWIGCTQVGCARGISLGDVSGVRGTDALLHACVHRGSGTFVTGSQYQCMIEGCVAYDNVSAGFADGAHADYIHSFSNDGLTGADYDAATKTITKVGGFANLYWDGYHAYIYPTTGVSGLESSYKVASADDDSITLYDDINGGADVTDGSLEFRWWGKNYDNLTIRGCVIYDNGSAGPYNFYASDNSGEDLAVYDNRSYQIQGQMQILQLEEVQTNAQIARNTLLASDNAEQDNTRGIYSGADGSWTRRLLIRNNLTHTIGIADADAITYRGRLYGPNLLTTQDTSGWVRTVDGNAMTDAGTLAALDLTDLSSTPPDWAPTTVSPAVPANGVITSAASDARFDAEGEAWTNDGTDPVGALLVEDTPTPDPATGALTLSLTAKLTSSLTSSLS